MKGASRGFTLLEVLVALSLLVLMFVLIGSALATGNRVLTISLQQGDRLDEMRAAQGFLRSALQQIRPVEFNGELFFEGNETRIRFIAPGPRYLGGGLKIHNIWVDEHHQQSHVLQVAFENVLEGGAWGTPQRLLGEAKHIRFNYRGVDEREQPTGWMSVWPWPARLPRQIRIELDAGGQVPWIPLIVSLHVQPRGTP